MPKVRYFLLIKFLKCLLFISVSAFELYLVKLYNESVFLLFICIFVCLKDAKAQEHCRVDRSFNG